MHPGCRRGHAGAVPTFAAAAWAQNHQSRAFFVCRLMEVALPSARASSCFGLLWLIEEVLCINWLVLGCYSTCDMSSVANMIARTRKQELSLCSAKDLSLKWPWCGKARMSAQQAHVVQILCRLHEGVPNRKEQCMGFVQYCIVLCCTALYCVVRRKSPLPVGVQAGTPQARPEERELLLDPWIDSFVDSSGRDLLQVRARWRRSQSGRQASSRAARAEGRHDQCAHRQSRGSWCHDVRLAEPSCWSVHTMSFLYSEE